MTSPTGDRMHVTERNASDAVDSCGARPKNQPFSLTVGFFAAHAQDNAPEQYLPQDWSAKSYEGVRIPPPLRGDAKYMAALPPFLSNEANEGRVRFHWRFDTPESYQAYVTRYYRLITEVDEAVGRLVDELRTQGVYDNTLIVFIGDNGTPADRGLADKWYPYEESIRVPLDRTRPAPAAGAAGQSAPPVRAQSRCERRRSSPRQACPFGGDARPRLSPLYLRTPAPAWRDEFFYEHPTITSKDRIPSSQGVIRRDWKYIEWPEFDYQQLFDPRGDQGRSATLPGTRRLPAVRRRCDSSSTPGACAFVDQRGRREKVWAVN